MLYCAATGLTCFLAKVVRAEGWNVVAPHDIWVLAVERMSAYSNRRKDTLVTYWLLSGF